MMRLSSIFPRARNEPFFPENTLGLVQSSRGSDARLAYRLRFCGKRQDASAIVGIAWLRRFRDPARLALACNSRKSADSATPDTASANLERCDFRRLAHSNGRTGLVVPSRSRRTSIAPNNGRDQRHDGAGRSAGPCRPSRTTSATPRRPMTVAQPPAQCPSYKCFTFTTIRESD
jgi:hypothetical protein